VKDMPRICEAVKVVAAPIRALRERRFEQQPPRTAISSAKRRGHCSQTSKQ
jgi:hypothetical protein